MCTGHLTSKSDVYSFGVVLLEMLSGRRALDKNRPSGEHNLVEWARPYLSNKRRIFRILDARLGGQYSSPEPRKRRRWRCSACLGTRGTGLPWIRWSQLLNTFRTPAAMATGCQRQMEMVLIIQGAAACQLRLCPPPDESVASACHVRRVLDSLLSD